MDSINPKEVEIRTRAQIIELADPCPECKYTNYQGHHQDCKSAGLRDSAYSQAPDDLRWCLDELQRMRSEMVKMTVGHGWGHEKTSVVWAKLKQSWDEAIIDSNTFGPGAAVQRVYTVLREAIRAE